LNDIVEHLEQEKDQMMIGWTGIQEPWRRERLQSWHDKWHKIKHYKQHLTYQAKYFAKKHVSNVLHHISFVTIT